MNILQDILGLITKGKVKPPTGKDYMVVASYTDVQEILKPQPKMQANLVSLAALKNYIVSSIAPPTPPAYKVYTALISQADQDNPEVIVLENTIGEIAWSYRDTGQYSAELTNAFTVNKTAFFISGLDGTSSGGGSPLGPGTSIIFQSKNRVDLKVVDSSGNPGDGYLLKYPIEIRVYN